MTASTSMSVFHQWLLADPTSQTSACAIVLHCDKDFPYSKMIEDIATYLNEYDDDGDGCWLPATPELVTKVASDPSQRRLLGLDQPQNAPISGHPRTLAALGQRGHVVFRSPGVPDHQLNLTKTFHAGIGFSENLPSTCHLVLNPELMDQKCIAHIIGDVFLEWLHCEMRRNALIQDIR